MYIFLQICFFHFLSLNVHRVARFVYLLFPMLNTIQFVLNHLSRYPAPTNNFIKITSLLANAVTGY